LFDAAKCTVSVIFQLNNNDFLHNFIQLSKHHWHAL